MKTYTALQNLFGELSLNTSTSNKSLGGQLISDQHRYLLQKYFDNERTYYTSTIGAEDITFTSALSADAKTATLDAAWTNPTSVQKVVFSNSDQREVTFMQGSPTITWQVGLSDAATTAASTVGVQFYAIPPQVSKIKNNTITIGQLQYTPAPVHSIQEWTKLNALPYSSDIPNYYYIYQDKVGFWPLPSTTGNIISFNYKARVPDLSFADYNTGTLTDITVGDSTITGDSTAWNSTESYPLNTDVSNYNLFLKMAPPEGDGIWYQIKQFNSDTSLELVSPVQNTASTTVASYTIGQLPLLQEDFHDMLVYGALKTYFSSIVTDKDKFGQYDNLYQNRMDLLEAYASDKSVNVDLGEQPVPNNPNLYIYARE